MRDVAKKAAMRICQPNDGLRMQSEFVAEIIDSAIDEANQDALRLADTVQAMTRRCFLTDGGNPVVPKAEFDFARELARKVKGESNG